MKPQVTKAAYAFERYTGPDRWASYYAQIRAILACAPSSVLEIGVGEGVVRDVLVHRGDIAYTSLDVAGDLHPDVVGDVTAMPFRDAQFDCVCAFEVLEHLPFSEFPKALQELARVSRGPVLVSLPHFGPPIKFLLKLPFFPEVRVAWKIPFPKKHTFNGQHYWEIGKRGYSPATIRAVIRTFFTIEQEFVPFENQYHHFYVLRKRSA